MSQYYESKNMFLEPEVKQYGSHMVMTNVVLPPKKKFVNIDTRFRDTYDYTSQANYTMTLPEKVTNVKSMQLRSMELPMTFYNFSKALGNNTFQVTLKNGETVVADHTFTVPDGKYTETTLAEAVNAALAGENAFTKVKFSITNKRAKFKNEYDHHSCVITFGEHTNNLKEMFGWALGYRLSTYTIPEKHEQQSDAFISIAGPKYIYVVLDEFKNGNPYSFLGLSNTSQLSSQQILARITMDYDKYPFGRTLVAEQYNYALSDVRKYDNEIDFQRFQLRLVNEFGRTMDLNGMDFSLCLELEHL